MRAPDDSVVDAEFAAFFARVQPRLQRALTAAYGVVDGRAATVDALSWAWEHWDRLRAMANPAGYLFRVGQTSAQRYRTRSLPVDLLAAASELPDVEPGLVPALGRLSDQQRTIVVLVHALGWTQVEVAELLDINPSTVRVHLDRAIRRLQRDLEVGDVR